MSDFKGSVLDNNINNSLSLQRLNSFLRNINLAIDYWNKNDANKAVFFIHAKEKCIKMLNSKQ